jgi:DNA processing protein
MTVSPFMRDEKRTIVALNTVPGLRAVLFHRALSTFGTAAGILEAGRKGLFRLPGAGPGVRKSLAGLRAEEAFAGEMAMARQKGVDIVTLFDAAYPASLLEVPDPPPVLYVRGTLLPADSAAVAIVGSRAATAYGKVTAGRLAGDLASCGLTVVSGLARGVDSCAHRGALEAGGRTIAVLGSGLDRPYPPENRSLIEEIASSGAVVSEFPFATIPDKRNFPERNRTISGLARGVVVVEAAARSGALITAGCALDQGREVFAVPGNVTSPLSAGPNALLRDGARLVESARDILEEFPDLPAAGPVTGEAGPGPVLSGEERSLLSRLDREPLTLDEVIRRSPLPSSRTVALLTALEIKGLVRQFAGRRFVRH